MEPEKRVINPDFINPVLKCKLYKNIKQKSE